MTTIHYVEGIAPVQTLCGIPIGPMPPSLSQAVEALDAGRIPITSPRPRDANCPACRKILDDQARGTVRRSMARRQLLQAEAKVAADVLWRRGYPLPDNRPRVVSDIHVTDQRATFADVAAYPLHDGPDEPCKHLQFESRVEVSRLSQVEDGPVTGHSADIRIRCADCGLPFRFIGLPGGLAPDRPMCSLAGDEARMPIEPMPAAMATALAGTAQPDSTPLRWHYGPTSNDPEPGKMWCYDCGGEVWYIKAGPDDTGATCSGCNRSE